MNDAPRHTLKRIIDEHGRAIIDTPKRVEALLRDLSPAHRREVNILAGALEERVAAELTRVAADSRERSLARLTRRLQDDLAYTSEAARWAVDSWAFALGVLTQEELAARERAAAEEARKIPPDATRAAQPKPPVTPPPRPTNPAPPRPAPRTPPIRSTSPVSPPPPVVRRTTAPPVASRPPIAPQAIKTTAPVSVQPTPAPHVEPPPARRGVTLRGCLVTLVLLVAIIAALVFVVPTVVMLLREEQSQPSINEPRVR